MAERGLVSSQMGSRLQSQASYSSAKDGEIGCVGEGASLKNKSSSSSVSPSLALQSTAQGGERLVISSVRLVFNDIYSLDSVGRAAPTHWQATGAAA